MHLYYYAATGDNYEIIQSLDEAFPRLEISEKNSLSILHLYPANALCNQGVTFSEVLLLNFTRNSFDLHRVWLALLYECMQHAMPQPI